MTIESLLIQIFGIENHLSTMQEAARAVLIFSYGLLLLRLSGPRIFGHWSALDIVISIMIGSALARTMTGGAPLVGTMAAAAVMTVLHVALAHFVARSDRMARIFEGKSVVLVDNGHVDDLALKRNKISRADLHEALREHGIDGEEKVSNVRVMTLEPSGKLSVVKIDPCKPDTD